MPLILTFLAVVSGIAVGVVVPLTFGVVDYKTIDEHLALFINAIQIIVEAYLVFNALSGVARANKFLYHADGAVSWFAWTMLNLTFGFVLFQGIREMFDTGPDIKAVLHLLRMPGFLVNLVLPTGFAWLDVFWIQRQKRRRMTEGSPAETFVLPPEVEGQPYVVLHLVFPWAHAGLEGIRHVLHQSGVPFLSIQRSDG